MLASALPESTAIVATDLNQPMLDLAIEIGTTRTVEWKQADAMQLPFPDSAFDVVACQFGVMFFPEKAKAFSEARRMLRLGGVLISNVWDRIRKTNLCIPLTRRWNRFFLKILRDSWFGLHMATTTSKSSHRT